MAKGSEIAAEAVRLLGIYEHAKKANARNGNGQHVSSFNTSVAGLSLYGALLRAKFNLEGQSGDLALQHETMFRVVNATCEAIAREKGWEWRLPSHSTVAVFEVNDHDEFTSADAIRVLEVVGKAMIELEGRYDSLLGAS